MIEQINILLRFIGLITVLIICVPIVVYLVIDYYWESKVSPEAKRMAKDTDPNNPFEKKFAAALLDNIRDLEHEESIKAQPQPLAYIDWSLKTADEDEADAILQTLQRGGYHTHPFPDIDTYANKGEWTRDRAGIWHEPPDWHIVEYDEQGIAQVKEEVELPLPDKWAPSG